MTPEMVTEVLRNLYNASGGEIPPTAVMSALSGLMWNDAWTSAGVAAEAVADRGGSFDEINDAFNKAFAESIGWSQADFERFLQDNNLDPESARQYQKDNLDPWDWMVRRNRR